MTCAMGVRGSGGRCTTIVALMVGLKVRREKRLMLLTLVERVS